MTKIVHRSAKDCGKTEFALVQHPMILLIHMDRGEPAVGVCERRAREAPRGGAIAAPGQARARRAEGSVAGAGRGERDGRGVRGACEAPRAGRAACEGPARGTVACRV